MLLQEFLTLRWVSFAAKLSFNNTYMRVRRGVGAIIIITCFSSSTFYAFFHLFPPRRQSYIADPSLFFKIPQTRVDNFPINEETLADYV